MTAADTVNRALQEFLEKWEEASGFRGAGCETGILKDMDKLQALMISEGVWAERPCTLKETTMKPELVSGERLKELAAEAWLGAKDESFSREAIQAMAADCARAALEELGVVQIEEPHGTGLPGRACHFRRDDMNRQHCTIMKNEACYRMCDDARCPLSKGAILVRVKEKP